MKNLINCTKSCFVMLLALTLAISLMPVSAFANVVGDEVADTGQSEGREPFGGGGASNGIEDVPDPSAHGSAEAVGLVELGTGDAPELGTGDAPEPSVLGFDSSSFDESQFSAYAGKTVIELGGSSRYETAAKEALHAYPDGSDYAIVASGANPVDALAVAGLAGALDAPILLTSQGALNAPTANALKELSPSHILIIGGEVAIGSTVQNSLAGYADNVVRIAGSTRYDTQLRIYEYGKQQGAWGTKCSVIVVTGDSSKMADALSVSPAAFAMKAPIFTVDGRGELPLATKELLAREGCFNRAIVAGGTMVVSDLAYGFLEAVSTMGNGTPNIVRLAGENRYDTSAQVARWSVSQGILKWDGAAFATGAQPFDALAGSALQGKERSVMLLVSDANLTTVQAAASSGASFNSIKFLGGTTAVSNEIRANARRLLGFSSSAIQYEQMNITLNDFVAKELSVLRRYSAYADYTSAKLLPYIDPSKVGSTEVGMLQFAVLSDGYSGMTAQQIDSFIASMCTYQESIRGVQSKLRGTGKFFVAAAKKYNVNEVYLVCHAGIESAWGCSSLAQGTIKGAEGYYNFFGITAYDTNPAQGGYTAKNKGWNTAEKAIMGGAEWIAREYIHPTVSSAVTSGAQDTLWLMRYDVRAAAKGASLHQYATAPNWGSGIASTMASFYRKAGISVSEAPLSYSIPAFK